MRANVFYVTLGQLIVALTPLILTPYLTRTIGASGIGLYSYTYNIASLFYIAGLLGIQLYGRREIAKCDQNLALRTQVFWELAGLLWKSFAFVTVVYCLYLTFGVSDQELRVAFLLQLFFLLSGALDVSWLFAGLENFRLVALSTVVARLFLLVGTVVLVQHPGDARAYVLISALAFLLSSIVPWFVVKRVVGRPKIGYLLSVRHLAPLMNFFIPSLALQASTVVGVAAIGFFMAVADVGFYDLSFRLSRAPIAFITVLGAVLLPRATKMIALGKRESNDDLLSRGMGITCFLAAGFSFGLSGVAPTLIPLYAGEGFESSIAVLQVLSVSLIFIGWGNVLRTQVVLPMRLDRVYSFSLVGGFVVCVVATLLLIRPMGLIGVAVAFVFSELVVAFLQAVAIRRIVPLRRLVSQAIMYWLGGAGVWLLLLMVGEAIGEAKSALLLQAVIGPPAYLILVLALEKIWGSPVVTKEVESSLLRILRRSKS